MDDYGWGGDHVGKLTKLQAAVQFLAEGSGTTKTRFKAATDALVHLRSSHFPGHLRNRAANVLGFRRKHMFIAGDEVYFRDVRPSHRRKFVRDLLALYEACLIDLGRGWPQWSFMYPNDVDATEGCIWPGQGRHRRGVNKQKHVHGMHQHQLTTVN